ncbi:MAG: AAA family ATPase, partial [Nevskiales bacterium]
MDEEDFRELVLGYQKAAGEVIERYEGHIAQYLGDGLLVYFGHPVAHEDDAERAVRCGYDILNALKRLQLPSPLAGEGLGERGLSARIGIHTGPVVVGQMGAGGRHETLAMGDTTNLAARIQGLAQADTVVISQTTLKLVPGLFITKDLGAPSLKGVTQPLPLYQIIQPSGVRSRLEAAEKLTPFVGRETELGLLNERWSQAQDGQGQAVLITAEAGLGKSRLLLMIHARLQETTHSWLECRAGPMTRNSAYQPIIELLNHGLQLKEGDTQAIKLQRLEQALDAIGLDKPDAVPLLAPLLNLTLPKPYEPSPYGPELKRKKTMDYLNGWLIALAKFQPLALVIEDLHWSDPSSLELLGRLIEQIPTANVLVLMTGRPEFQPNWPQKSQLSNVSLKPLPNKQVAAMLDSLTGHKPLPAIVAQKIQERANGVPLFIEEVTKQLLESGQLIEHNGRLELSGSIDQLAIPETLQDSLMARLDKQGEAKEIAQVGAVIGREISYKLLALVTEQDEAQLQNQLKTLTDAELLYQRGNPPDSTYLFKHALIRDTAYNSLLKS